MGTGFPPPGISQGQCLAKEEAEQLKGRSEVLSALPPANSWQSWQRFHPWKRATGDMPVISQHRQQSGKGVHPLASRCLENAPALGTGGHAEAAPASTAGDLA